MQNSRLPIVLLLLGVGILVYQFVVHPTAKEQDFTNHFLVGHGDLAEDASDSNFVSSSHKKSSFAINHRVVGLAPAAPAPEAIPVEASPSLAPAPVDMKALAKATDDKTKAADKKKKKKKKTVSPNIDTSVQAQVAPTATLANNYSDVPPAPVAPAAPATPVSNGGSANANAAARTNAMARYYENLLLKEPDSAATQKFVAAHKAKQISDDVYFTVATAMMADSRLQMKDLAVYVYGQAINIKSFIALVNVIDTDSSNDVVKTDSLKYLNGYSDVTATNTVNVLAQALNTAITSPSLHIEALKLLDTATKQYAQLEMSSQSVGGGQVNASAYTPTNAEKIFVPFVSILNTLVRGAADTTTKTIASQDLGDLQNLFGSQSASINP